MNDQEVCQWLIDQREVLNKFIGDAIITALPARQEAFRQLLAINNDMDQLFWAINIARDREHLDRLASPR